MADGLKRPDMSTEDRAARPLLSGMIGTGERSSRRIASPHANKFVVATSALIAIAVIAVTVAIVTARNSNNSGPLPVWSSWSPPDSGYQGAVDIANHLAPFYRISGTAQLDAVTVLNVANPATAASSSSGTPPNQIEVALGSAASAASGTNSGSSGSSLTSGSSNNAVQLLGGRTIAYNLCGLSATNSCAIGEGTASSQRLLLLRREGLELALYTFRYIKGIDNVVAVMPPGTTAATNTLSPTPPSETKATASAPLDLALLFDRQELKPWTNQPLADTLSAVPPAVPQLVQWSQTEEAALVDQLTARGLFSDQFEKAPDGSRLLVLNQLPPQ
jgi:hypothetical protein